MKRTFVLIAALYLVLAAGTAVADVAGGGDLTFKPEKAKPVIFSHALHVNVKELKCSACHNHTFQMSKDSTKMDMSKITKGKFCVHRHKGARSLM
jgi:c(7)-type cytochrome triheme protein